MTPLPHEAEIIETITNRATIDIILIILSIVVPICAIIIIIAFKGKIHFSNKNSSVEIGGEPTDKKRRLKILSAETENNVNQELPLVLLVATELDSLRNSVVKKCLDYFEASALTVAEMYKKEYQTLKQAFLQEELQKELEKELAELEHEHKRELELYKDIFIKQYPNIEEFKGRFQIREIELKRRYEKLKEDKKESLSALFREKLTDFESRNYSKFVDLLILDIKKQFYILIKFDKEWYADNETFNNYMKLKEKDLHAYMDKKYNEEFEFNSVNTLKLIKENDAGPIHDKLEEGLKELFRFSRKTALTIADELKIKEQQIYGSFNKNIKKHFTPLNKEIDADD